ncbi:MAG: hypothetical protein OSA99_02420 [Acidimicrobiales bacterium]|nr:hypothetical protein [Acidimicrobiales bacterium]
MERRVEASAAMHVSAGAAQVVLRSTPELVLGEPEPGPRRGRRTFNATLPAQLRPGTTVEQAVLVSIMPLHTGADPEHASAPLTWEPTGLQRLLPRFAGELRVGPIGRRGSRLTVRGHYSAPLGRVGRFGDSVLGHRVARRSLELYVDRIAQRIDHEALRRHTTSTIKPAPYNEDLRPHSRSRSSRD